VSKTTLFPACVVQLSAPVLMPNGNYAAPESQFCFTPSSKEMRRIMNSVNYVSRRGSIFYRSRALQLRTTAVNGCVHDNTGLLEVETI
jgi:hypothetical protein